MEEVKSEMSPEQNTEINKQSLEEIKPVEKKKRVWTKPRKKETVPRKPYNLQKKETKPRKPYKVKAGRKPRSEESKPRKKYIRKKETKPRKTRSDCLGDRYEVKYYHPLTQEVIIQTKKYRLLKEVSEDVGLNERTLLNYLSGKRTNSKFEIIKLIN